MKVSVGIKEQHEGFLVIRIMFCIFTTYQCQYPVCDYVPQFLQEATIGRNWVKATRALHIMAYNCM